MSLSSGGARRRAFVLISTDKAVDPTSVMGATKRLAEQLTVRGRPCAPDDRTSAVRFGNVLGSRQHRAAVQAPARRRAAAHDHPAGDDALLHDDPRGGQPDPGGRRLGSAGEVFVLDMGEPVRIVDLARDLVRLDGTIPTRSGSR